MINLLISALLLGCSEKADDEANSPEEAETVEEIQFREISEDGMSVESLDPVRYLGVWHEIASIPSGPQASCTGTSAEYGIIDDETISVKNTCYLYDLDGQLSVINGTATFNDDTYTRLTVDFGFGFGAPYLVTELDGSQDEEPYRFAAVSSFQTLWILSRTPQMDMDLYDEIVSRLESRGYPVEDLEMTLQPEE